MAFFAVNIRAEEGIHFKESLWKALSDTKKLQEATFCCVIATNIFVPFQILCLELARQNGRLTIRRHGFVLCLFCIKNMQLVHCPTS